MRADRFGSNNGYMKRVSQGFINAQRRHGAERELRLLA
jgi:hypothetical protein